MGKLSVLCFIVLLSITGMIAQPKIQAEGGTTLELGDVFNGTKAEHLVTIKNVGTDTLKILEVKAQCGCTAAMMTATKLAPSASGKLSISFDTHNYNGKVTKQVYV